MQIYEPPYTDGLLDIEGIWRLKTRVKIMDDDVDFVTIVKFESACNSPSITFYVDGRSTIDMTWNFSGFYSYSNPAQMNDLSSCAKPDITTPTCSLREKFNYYVSSVKINDKLPEDPLYKAHLMDNLNVEYDDI